ncbi:MAG: hypothetical protein AB8F74_18785 [Saprospiraceae bacterium]
MKIKFVLFFIYFSTVGCKNTSRVVRFDSETQIKEIHFEKLDCIELSENFKRISTQNDEILVLYYLLKNETEIVDKKRSSYLKFDSEVNSIALTEKIIVPKELNNYKLKIVLIEQDTDRSEIAVQELVSQNLDKNEKELSQIILDDDLLGVKEMELRKLKQNEINIIKYWGVHLFDEYEYKIYFMVE